MSRKKPSRPPGSAGTYFEFTSIGAQVRVAAIDGATGTEVVVFGPASTPVSRLEDVAQAKLNRALAEASGEDTARREGEDRGAGEPKPRGRWA